MKKHKMSIGHHAHKMMHSHKVRSEPLQSSGGHKPHAPYPLPMEHNHIPNRPHVRMGKKGSRGQTPYGVVPD